MTTVTGFRYGFLHDVDVGVDVVVIKAVVVVFVFFSINTRDLLLLFTLVSIWRSTIPFIVYILYSYVHTYVRTYLHTSSHTYSSKHANTEQSICLNVC